MCEVKKKPPEIYQSKNHTVAMLEFFIPLFIYENKLENEKKNAKMVEEKESKQHTKVTLPVHSGKVSIN